jgi:hypothetical protein
MATVKHHSRARILLPSRGGQRAAIGAFGVAFVVMLAIALAQDAKPFYYDSGVYWILGTTFVEDGAFSLLNFDNPTRGYLIPLITHSLAELTAVLGWDASSLVKLFNALVFALIATVLAPKLAKLTWPEKVWGFWRRLGVAALLLLFWSPYLNFPLSDFPALTAALLALVAASRPAAPGWMLVAGVATAAAINMRPAYIVAIPVVLGLIAFGLWQQRDVGAPRASVWRRTLCVLLLLLGFVAISLPQALATHRHHEKWSFVPGAARGLSSLQFTEGMRLQRYETFVGTGQPGPSMRYQDVTGVRILEQRGDSTIDDYGEYLGVVAGHPLEMAGIFVRHAINGLDQRYRTPYVESSDTSYQPWLRLFGFLLVFLAVARLAWPATRRSLGPARWRYLGALLLCAAPSIVSAVETRFMLPAYLCAYLAVFAPGWANPFPPTQSVAARIRVAALWLTGLAVYFAIVVYVINGATDQLRLV